MGNNVFILIGPKALCQFKSSWNAASHLPNLGKQTLAHCLIFLIGQSPARLASQ